MFESGHIYYNVIGSVHHTHTQTQTPKYPVFFPFNAVRQLMMVIVFGLAVSLCKNIFI